MEHKHPGFDPGIMWAMAALAFAGTIMNVFLLKECFYLWAVSNAILAVHNGRIKQWHQCALFAAYFVLAIIGIVYWTATGAQ